MCGIAGFTGSDQKLISTMTQTLAHRGPDGQDVFVDSRVSLGHRRLAIIDLSPGGVQPMRYQNFVITFNGEIYNYLELKQQLRRRGHKFKTNSDTEVILHAFEEWGDRCFSKFNGMWALAIYHTKTGDIFLSRDHFGIKPLYYQHHHGQLIFASEIKSLLAHTSVDKTINPATVTEYFFNRFISSPQTIYQHILSLPPGYNATFNYKTGRLRLRRWYNLESQLIRAQSRSVADRIEEVGALLTDVVKTQLISDVPVGSFLSGGLDSSLLSELATQFHPQRLKTFSIGFGDSSYDESEFARTTAKFIGSHHTTKQFSVDDQVLSQVFAGLDQPLGDPALIPTYLVSRLARDQVAVALSGDGADEIFAGYDTYRSYLLTQQIPPAIFKLLQPLSDLIPDSNHKVSSLFLLKRFLGRYHPDPLVRHVQSTAVFMPTELMSLLDQGFLNQRTDLDLFDTYFFRLRAHLGNFVPGLESPRTEKNVSAQITIDDITELQLHDIHHYLSGDILIKTDLASMMTGLEVRVPYLDYRLVPLVLSLPREHKLNWRQGKLLLRSLAKDKVPPSIIKRRKRGFSVPLHQLFKNSQLLQEILLSRHYYQHNLLNHDYVSRLWKEQQSGSANLTRELWLVAVFNYWYKNQLG